MKIKMKASTMVKPATATATTAIWISNLDAIMPEKLHVPEIYVYRSTGADDFFDPVALKASLSQALVEFYPLAGRLRRDVNGRIEIDCNGEGAFFAEAECDGALADFGDFILPEINLVPPVDYSGGISTYPLLLVQVTHFRCGGVTFGFAAEHHVTDRYSIDHFLNTWAEISSGRDITTRPFFDRRLLAARNPPKLQFPHIGYLPPPTLRNSKGDWYDGMRYEWNGHSYIHSHSYDWYDFESVIIIPNGMVIPKALGISIPSTPHGISHS